MRVKQHETLYIITNLLVIILVTTCMFLHDYMSDKSKIVFAILQIIGIVFYTYNWNKYSKEYKKYAGKNKKPIINSLQDSLAYNVYIIIEYIFAFTFGAYVLIIYILKYKWVWLTYWYWFILGMYIAGEIIYMAYRHLSTMQCENNNLKQ